MRCVGTFLAVSLLLAQPVFAGSDEPKVRVGDVAPDFSLRDLDSNLVRLSDMAYAGKEVKWKKKHQVLLDFFRTDCKPCLKKLPEVVAYQQSHKGSVQVILIALLESENGREKLDAFLKERKLPFPVLIDAYETVAKKYIVEGETLTLPAIFLIDQNGIVRAKLQEMKESLEASLQKALAKKAG